MSKKFSPMSFINAIHGDKDQQKIIDELVIGVCNDLRKHTGFNGRVVGVIIDSTDELVVKQLGLNQIFVVKANEATESFEFDLVDSNEEMYNRNLLREISMADGAVGIQKFKE